PPAPILPALARLKAQRAQQPAKPLLRSRRTHLRHQRDSLDHPSIVSSAALRLPLQLQVVRCWLFVAGEARPLESASNLLVCLRRAYDSPSSFVHWPHLLRAVVFYTIKAGAGFGPLPCRLSNAAHGLQARLGGHHHPNRQPAGGRLRASTTGPHPAPLQE